MFKKIISIIITVLCLGFISCGEEIHGPILITGGNGQSGANWVGMGISPLICKSDLIFVGKCIHNEIEYGSNYYISLDLKIVEVLKGRTNDTKASFVFDGYFATFEEGGKYIFFVRKDGDSFVPTIPSFDYSYPSVMAIDIPYIPESFYYKNDIKLILADYYKNRELFSKAGKQDLFNLYAKLKNGYIKSSILFDLENIIDENDTKFFAIGLQSDDVQYNLFSIRKIGNFKIKKFEETLIGLLKTTPESDKNKIQHLLCALRDYVDIKNKDIFLDYINSEDATYRNISYHAIGLLGDEATILALVPYYEKETESSHRLAILSALENIKNNDVLIPVLLELKKIEPIEYMVQHIDWIIAKRIGG